MSQAESAEFSLSRCTHSFRKWRSVKGSLTACAYCLWCSRLTHSPTTVYKSCRSNRNPAAICAGGTLALVYGWHELLHTPIHVEVQRRLGEAANEVTRLLETHQRELDELAATRHEDETLDEPGIRRAAPLLHYGHIVG